MIVINGKQDGFIGTDRVYVGRGNSYKNLKESPLHNPFKISESCNREQAIALYKQHLWQSIKSMRDGNPPDRIANELINLARVEQDILKTNTELKLVCYCKPLGCHGDIIISAINWLKTQDWFFDVWVF